MTRLEWLRIGLELLQWSVILYLLYKPRVVWSASGHEEEPPLLGPKIIYQDPLVEQQSAKNVVPFLRGVDPF